DGHAHAVSTELRALVQQADSQGRKYLSAVASSLLAESMIADKQYVPARQQLQRTLGNSEKLGTRLLTAEIHYLLGRISGSLGDAPEARNQYLQAKNLLDEIAKEQGAEHLADRSDIKLMYQEINRNSK